MNDIKIDYLSTSTSDLLGHPGHKKKIEKILGQNWIEGQTLIDRVEKMSRINVAQRRDTEEILGFSVWTQKLLQLDDRPLLTAYMGMTAVDTRAKGLGIGSNVVIQSMKEAQATIEEKNRTLQNSHPLSPILWGTTASPVAFLGLSKIFPSMWPKEDKAMDLGIIETLRKNLGASEQGPSEPNYLMKGLSKSRYPSHLLEKFKKIEKDIGLPFFDDLDVSLGDRILLIFSTGEHDL